MKVALFILAALALASGAARAAVPSPPNCTFDHVITASWNNVPAPGGLGPCSSSPAGFDVWVRDVNNVPIPNSQVKITFAGSGTSIRPYRLQGPQGPVTIHCGDHSISVLTDGQGHANFTPHFGRYGEFPTIELSADNVILGNITARSCDFDCDGDVDVLDFSQFSADFADANNYHYRIDYDDCPSTTLGDFLIFASQFLASGAGTPYDVCP